MEDFVKGNNKDHLVLQLPAAGTFSNSAAGLKGPRGPLSSPLFFFPGEEQDT